MYQTRPPSFEQFWKNFWMSLHFMTLAYPANDPTDEQKISAAKLSYSLLNVIPKQWSDVKTRAKQFIDKNPPQVNNLNTWTKWVVALRAACKTDPLPLSLDDVALLFNQAMHKQMQKQKAFEEELKSYLPSMYLLTGFMTCTYFLIFFLT